jgi:pyruvate-ferredoxin/flavodoxin oxidoreductase
MSFNHRQQDMAVKSGHWPLFRFNPDNIELGKPPLKLDSKAPSIPYKDFVQTETRFNMLWHTDPETAEELVEREQKNVNHRYNYYKQLSQLDWSDSEQVAQVKASARTPATKTEGES